jgi:choline dehydrogenase-like flavoprotein
MHALETHAALSAPYDAVIIGSGAGGSAVAYRLTQAGKRVLVVERGTWLKPDKHSNSASIGTYMYDITAQAEPNASFVGGLTKFYGAGLYRLRASDFTAVQHENGMSTAWPIPYETLEPYYAEAEQLYRVHGDAGADATEPPRSAPLPYPAIAYAPPMQALSHRLTAAGYACSPIPRGLDYGPNRPCVLCPTCDAYYCKLDAKMDAETAALRPALATGTMRLVTETTCLRILTHADGTTATGVELLYQGQHYTVHAGTVVVSAGIPHSAQLLRRSHTSAHPMGLGNAGGALGRYYGGHSVGMIFPLLSLRPMAATHTKSFAINQFYHGAPDWPYPLGVIQTAGQTPYWKQAAWWMRPLAYLVSKCSVLCFYMSEALPARESGFYFAANGDIEKRVEPTHNLKNFERLRHVSVAAFRRAGYRTIARRRPPYLWHEVGTARMGDNPASSVVDANGQVHGIRGLYVADASVLPSAGAINTVLTIIALALRTGDAILAQCKR